MSLLRFLLRRGASRGGINGSGDVVLCYHDIGHDDWDFTISPSEFIRQISYLNRHFCVVSLANLAAGPNHSGQPRAAITFDDGHWGVYRYAYPLLTRLGIPATVFALEDPQVTKVFPGSKLMRVKELKTLIKAGWEVGYHTSTHPDLTKVNSSRLHAEIVLGKIRLEKKLGSRLRFFAIPYGLYNPSVITYAQKHFFRLLTVNGGPACHPRHPRLLDRVTISRHLSTGEFTTLLTPTGIALNRAFTWAWRIKDKFSI